VEVEFEVEVLDGGGDATLFIAGGDYDGEHFRRLGESLRGRFGRGRGWSA
jgi:hypothetical protein